MFHNNHFLFDSLNFADDFKPAASQLPTTAHNSPGSLKSKSFSYENSPFNCSFDEGAQSGHAQAVWEASIKFLQAAIKQFVDHSKGMNEQSLYNSVGSNQILKQETVEQMIMKNPHLKIQQKHQFVSDIQNQNELMDLMRQLSSLFNQCVFHEITYVINKIWQKKAQSQLENSKINKQQEFQIPHFDCFWGYEEEEIPVFSSSPISQLKTYEQVIESANKCSDQIAEQLYFDNKLRLLNLRDCKKQIDNEHEVASLFSEFFKALAKSVYLSSEGFFNQALKGDCEKFDEQFTNDIDFQFNEVSAFEELQGNQNRFVRSFSQSLEDDEQDFELGSGPNKKRKLQ